MASDSTNLTDILSPAADIDHDVARRAADAAIAAGWRPPARVIETAVELDALPDTSAVVVIAPGTSKVFQLLTHLGPKGGRLWTAPFLRARYDSDSLIKRFRSVTVLYVPTEEAHG